ncbi:MAG: hypothetical protein AB1571_00325 [Nanoarchaeota archaeon]
MISEKYKVFPSAGIQIRHTGIIDINNLYKKMQSWFKDNNYIFVEKEHTVKDKASGKEIVLKWEATRDVDDYARFVITVNFFFENLAKEGNAMKGFAKITFWADVLLDYRKAWQRSRLLKFLFFLYNNYVIKRRIIEVYDTKLNAETTELYNLTKDILGVIKE